jgi:perosamine synthetase
MNYIPVSRPLLTGNEKRYVNEALDSGWISSDGPFIEKFENEFAKRVNRKYGVSVSNGTAALEISIKALGIGVGDEVILPSFTIVSCLLAILRSGATPVFLDSHIDTWNMETENLENFITEKTKAIMPVHIYGLPVEMKDVIEISNKYKISVVEDAAEAHGQTYFGKPCGSFGTISTFSFYANKHVTTGEGGMIVTDDEDLANSCKKLRNLSFEPGRRFVHKDLGWNYRMTNLQAALGLAQLENLDQTITRKRIMGEMYQNLLSNQNSILNPVRKRPGYENHYWVYGVLMKSDSKLNANSIMEKLHQKGIGTRPFFWPMHKQPLLQKLSKVNYPNAEFMAENGFYLPSGVGTTDEEIEKTATALAEIIK